MRETFPPATSHKKKRREQAENVLLNFRVCHGKEAIPRSASKSHTRIGATCNTFCVNKRDRQECVTQSVHRAAMCEAQRKPVRNWPRMSFPVKERLPHKHKHHTEKIIQSRCLLVPILLQTNVNDVLEHVSVQGRG